MRFAQSVKANATADEARGPDSRTGHRKNLVTRRGFSFKPTDRRLGMSSRASRVYVIAAEAYGITAKAVYVSRRLDDIHPFGMITYNTSC